MTVHVHCGTFDAEVHWRETDLAALPRVGQHGAGGVAEAMDELLFAFCDRGDYLLTLRRMSDVQLQYLRELGFEFHSNSFDIARPDAARASPPVTIFQQMLAPSIADPLRRWLPTGATLDPFAVVPGVHEAARCLELTAMLPSLDRVGEVNTKSYSHRMREQLELPDVGAVVTDLSAFRNTGADLLRRGPFLAKDDFGVSGRGNLVVDSEPLLLRIERHLSRQLDQGKRLRLVLEPLLEKILDFSCQFEVQLDGSTEFISVKQLENPAGGFGTSASAPPALMELLERRKYFSTMAKIGALLYSDGYRGHVCVDSMVLQGGRVFPLVEINARKSMSLIQHAMERYLERFALTGELTYVSGRPNGTRYETLLDALRDEGLLFTPNRPAGAIPLSCRTLYAEASHESGNAPPGRLYLLLVSDGKRLARDRTARDELRQVMKRVGLHTLQ